MARKSILFINIFLCILSVIVVTRCSKLNVPRVLLPIFNDFSTNFTLEVTEGGCYKWTTSRLDLVQIIPLDYDSQQDCSSSVVVSTISKEPTKNTAIVLAEDIYTGQVLRCDVIVDVISSLNIVTTTRELFMEEAPEAFEVRAYDDQGNEFTTLEGIQFEWTLSGTTSNVLRFITFRDSPYETPPTVQAFEAIGKQGHIILLEGVKTGSAKVSVHLPYPEYKKLGAIEVSLMVIANLLIEPADVYILRGDVVHYKIIQVKHGRLEEIKLPSSQYFLVSEDTNIGLIEKNSGYLTGMTMGKTRVYLHDRNVNEKDSGLKLPSATVYVIAPDRITLSLLPHRNWAVMLGETHDIVVEVFASNGHKIHLGDGVYLKTLVDEKYFKVSYRSTNGSWIVGQTIEQGVTDVQTTLVSVLSTKLGTIAIEPKLSAKADMLIFPSIHLNPAEVVLPWDPAVRPKYEVELKATGGDGKLLWSTSDHTIGIVTQSGLVRTHHHGQFDTCASMTRNHHNRKCARFYIIPPSRLEIVEFVMEAEIGMPIFLNVALYGERPESDGSTTQIPFTKCKELPFEVKSSDNNFYYNESAVGEIVGVSCASVGVVGLVPGTSRITIMYNRDDIRLEESVTVSAYRPLELLQPASGETVLALGTTRYLIFTGGPRPWAGRPSEHVVKLVSSNPNVVQAIDATQTFKVPGGSDTYVINVLCKDLGEATVTLTVFNKPLVPNCKHQESVASATVVCATPQFIYLQPEIKVADTSSCPMDLSSEKVIVQSYRNIDLIVNVKDGNGRKFDNISSLEFKWMLNPADLGTVMNKDSVYQKMFYEENVALPNKSYQVIIPQSQTGIIDVEASIIGYHQSVLKTKKIKTVPKLELISTMVTLYLVDDTIVLPNKTSIYNHPLNKQKLAVKQGSGYYELTLSSNEVAEVKYNEGLRQIDITPKQTGELHVSVTDLCLKCPPVIVVLNIVYVASIRVEMSDRVEIGKCIPAIVKFYDEFDNLMPLPKLEYLDVRFSLGDKIVNIKLEEESADDPWPVGEVHYVVTGLQLGETKLVFVSGRGDKEVVSLPINIQVFSPLRIYPRNATLMVGSVLQLTSQGGPQPDTNIEYTIDSHVIADISLHGIVHALSIGQTKVTARSVSINPISGQKVSNSQDSVEVFVIPLVGIKISAPLTRFVEGATIPVWATGLPERLSSLILGSIDPPMTFSWGTRCSDVVTLHGFLHPLGIRDHAHNKISVRAKGMRPGHCTLELNVTVSGATAGLPKKPQITYTSTLDVEVIEGLHLSTPYGFTGKAILIAPHSKMALKTNKEGCTDLEYSVHGEEHSDPNTQSVSVGRRILSVSNSGVVQSHGTLGRAVVVITAIDDHGLKQTLSLVVEVKPVHYMLLSVKADWMVSADEEVDVLPVGAELKLVTSYHDNTGARFSAAQCDIFFRTSRYDLLEIKRDSDTTHLNALSLNEGATVIKVWADNCLKTADYVQLFSGQIALPRTNIVTSGDVLCMWSPVVDKLGRPGEWAAEPDNAINVNASSGIGYVVSTRSTKAYIKYDLAPTAAITLDVEPVSEISFVFDHVHVCSNPPDSSFRVPILFKDARNPHKRKNLYAGWQCHNLLEAEITSFPFSCHIAFVNESTSPNIWSVFEVQPAFNKDLGLYSCNLIPSSPISANTSMIESNITLYVISDNGVESPPLEVHFLPAIFISNKELVIKESNTATITITGLPEVLNQVTVVPVDSALIEIGRVKHLTPNVVSYDIKVIDYHWKLEELKDPLSIVITSKLTNQHIKMQVKLGNNKMSGPSCSARQMGSPIGNFMYENQQTFIIIVSMLVLFFVTFYAYSHYIQPVINVNVGPGRSGGAHRCAVNSNSSGDRSMLLNTSLNTSSNRTMGCTNSTCFNRTLNTSSSPTMRYGTGEVIRDTRTLGNSPELRRNRRFL